MILFENILKELSLLTEDASVNDINDSITNMHPAIITYKNNEGDREAKGNRKIYPVAYGISTAGNPVVRAFEPMGDTTTKVPAWKLFIVPNIMTWKTQQDESFEDEELTGLNKEGNDKQIETLYNVSPLSDTAKKWVKHEPIIGSTPIEKADIEGGGEYSAKDMVDATINKVVSNKTIDNSKNKDYNNKSDEVKRIMAEPETKPVEQDDINEPQIQEPVNEPQQDNKEKMYADDNPVEKEELDNGEENNETPEISTAYNDMMDRWKNPQEE